MRETALRRSSSRRIDLEEILVPAHGDAVLGDAAESRHHPIVERSCSLAMSLIGLNGTRSPVRRRRRSRLRSGSIFSPSMPTTVMAVVQQMVREREARRPLADDQHALAGAAADTGARRLSGFQRVSRP